VSSRETVLVVDDDEALREACCDALSEAGYRALAAASPLGAEPLLLREMIDLVISDLRMPDGGGTRVIQLAHRLCPGLPIILITAFPSVSSAVDALRSGVVDYLIKPFDAAQLLQSVQAVLEVGRARDHSELLRRIQPAATEAPEIVGSSLALRSMLEDARHCAILDAHVLVTGETGTGKELVAKAIHRLSQRAGGPFVPVNCAAIPEALFESEIFGHEKGAFTGALHAKRGLIEEADGGTLFLDEVGDMPAPLQAKLLRAIEEGACRRIGALKARSSNVRVVSATNKDLRQEIAAGRFREDMYYRLAALEVHVPPLRDRGEDLVQLAVHFLGTAQAADPPRVVGFSDDALELLQGHAWPGNIRELQNVVQRLLARARGVVVTADLVRACGALPTQDRSVTHSKRRAAMGDFEKDYLEATLAENEGNVTHTAKALGIHRTTLQRLMSKYGLRTK